MITRFIISACIYGMLITTSVVAQDKALVVGAERDEIILPKIAGKKLALVVNQSSLVRGQHLIDHLIAHGSIIDRLFAVEHGIRGKADAGAIIHNSEDKTTGLPIYSLYGKQKQPAAKALENIDVLIFDLQDVGVRFFTYLSSLHYVMQSCADTGTPLIILDRPNPNGAYIDGPILEKEHASFVGMHPIPLLHGMTLGELGQMINGEGWLADGFKCDLTVVPMANYSRKMAYDLPVRPSPNLPNAQAVRLYPSLALFEATNISVGRGTAFPFQLLGGINPSFGDFSFMPVSTQGAASAPKHMDIHLYGEDLRLSKMNGLDLSKFLAWHHKLQAQNMALVTHQKWLAKLMGTEKFYHQITAGLSEAEIKKSWEPGLADYIKARQKYLIYSE